MECKVTDSHFFVSSCTLFKDNLFTIINIRHKTMRKKTFQHVLLLLTLMIAGHLTAWAYSFEVDGIYYNKNGNNATVTYRDNNYNSYSGEVTIPSTVTYDGVTYTVTAVGDNAF